MYRVTGVNPPLAGDPRMTESPPLAAETPTEPVTDEKPRKKQDSRDEEHLVAEPVAA